MCPRRVSAARRARSRRARVGPTSRRKRQDPRRIAPPGVCPDASRLGRKHGPPGPQWEAFEAWLARSEFFAWWVVFDIDVPPVEPAAFMPPLVAPFVPFFA